MNKEGKELRAVILRSPAYLACSVLMQRLPQPWAPILQADSTVWSHSLVNVQSLYMLVPAEPRTKGGGGVASGRSEWQRSQKSCLINWSLQLERSIFSQCWGKRSFCRIYYRTQFHKYSLGLIWLRSSAGSTRTRWSDKHHSHLSAKTFTSALRVNALKFHLVQIIFHVRKSMGVVYFRTIKGVSITLQSPIC